MIHFVLGKSKSSSALHCWFLFSLLASVILLVQTKEAPLTKNENNLVNYGIDDDLLLLNGTKSLLSKIKIGDKDDSNRWETLELERSVGAVLKKVAYGTTTTTKRSIPENSYSAALTTIATPILTTQRYLEKSVLSHGQINSHYRNYEVDLDRDHALPTSAPNADILKSNNNPTYPNPNRHDHRNRPRYVVTSTPAPSLFNLLTKTNGQMSTAPVFASDKPSYSPPSRYSLTPRLPADYQHPFADKPTLRGTNNEDFRSSSGMHLYRRPIPPPSLMPGHERIPLRPLDISSYGVNVTSGQDENIDTNKVYLKSSLSEDVDLKKKVLNTPFQVNSTNEDIKKSYYDLATGVYQSIGNSTIDDLNTKYQEVLPSIRRMLSGSNGKKSAIPEVLLKQVTTGSSIPFPEHSSATNLSINQHTYSNSFSEQSIFNPVINRKKLKDFENGVHTKVSISTKSALLPDSIADTQINNNNNNSNFKKSNLNSTSVTSDKSDETVMTTVSSKTNYLLKKKHIFKNGTGDSVRSSSATGTEENEQINWNFGWGLHIYLCVILFTIMAVYLFYKILTYDKLTHFCSQSYFLCIHFMLLFICTTRIYYLCSDAYNMHGTFHVFVAELLLNLPAAFLTAAFSVLNLHIFIKAFNHKNNRYSSLIRPLTVIVGCGVHVILCITLHYVEAYTSTNKNVYYQQQHIQYYKRQQQQNSQLRLPDVLSYSSPSGVANIVPPPRVLSMICQIIYIFLCLSLGVLYLYLYRIIKRVLLNKSQSYVHGFQSLAYAIHITAGVAVLFVVLALVQIFGALCVAGTDRVVVHATTEYDWTYCAYQFSVRIIEVAIIILISWVGSLKISSPCARNPDGDHRFNGSGAIARSSSFEEKAASALHSNVANLFLPCTDSSSQDHVDTDFSAICNANSNLHTYNMRTGKIIYEESFALNAMGENAQNRVLQSAIPVYSQYQLHHPAYHNPYSTSSMRSSTKRAETDYEVRPGSGTLHNQHRYNYATNNRNRKCYADYIADTSVIDHYENPNFDLNFADSAQVSSNTNSDKFLPKCVVSESACTPATTSSNCSSASQLKLHLIGADGSYSEPLHNTTDSSDIIRFDKTQLSSGVGYMTDEDNASFFLPESYNESVIQIGISDSEPYRKLKKIHCPERDRQGSCNSYGRSLNSDISKSNTALSTDHSSRKIIRKNSNELNQMECTASVRKERVASSDRRQNLQQKSSNRRVLGQNVRVPLTVLQGNNHTKYSNSIAQNQPLCRQQEKKTADQSISNNEVALSKNMECTNLIDSEETSSVYRTNRYGNSNCALSNKQNTPRKIIQQQNESGGCRALLSRKNETHPNRSPNKKGPPVIAPETAISTSTSGHSYLVKERCLLHFGEQQNSLQEKPVEVHSSCPRSNTQDAHVTTEIGMASNSTTFQLDDDVNC